MAKLRIAPGRVCESTRGRRRVSNDKLEDITTWGECENKSNEGKIRQEKENWGSPNVCGEADLAS